ncbi:hypothetical protein GOV10_06475, partial [Candidatus Woesearchaeota archaeon]|nr:hypothetical protein [Candidatus Woesearchaeota archaeon]
MVETRKQLFLAFCILLLVPAVLGANLDEISITYLDMPVRTLAPDKTLDVQLKLVISGSDLEECKPVGGTRCTAIIDTSGLNPDSDDIQFSLEDCERDETEHTCTASTSIKATDNSLEYSLKVFAPVVVLSSDGAFPLTLDDTIPVLSKLETAFCKDGLCFVGSIAPTYVTATFDDTLTSFDYKLVRFDVGGASGHATTCRGHSCTGVVDSGYCSDGHDVNVRVTNFYGSFPSSEDAMNPVENSRQIVAKCDAEEPILDSFNVYSEGLIPQLFETSFPLRMSALLTDMTGGEIRVEVNTSGVSETDDIVTSTCEEINTGEFSCELQILNLINGTHELT